jgi:site-specific recombinase XerD
MPEVVVSPRFAAFMQEAVSDDRPAAFPISGYRAHVAAWLTWCYANGVDPEKATTSDVARHHRVMLEADDDGGAAAYRAVALRWFYQSVIAAGLRRDNPAAASGLGC